MDARRQPARLKREFYPSAGSTRMFLLLRLSFLKNSKLDKIMKNTILPALFSLVVLFAANQASAYYSPSTGRWLSRDPMGEPGFETLRSASVVPRVGQVAGAASLPPSRLFVRDSSAAQNEPNRYGFVSNHPVNDIDVMGLLVGSVSFPQYYGYMTTSTFWAERGLQVEIFWNAPAEWGSKPCCRCMVAVWTQYNMDGTIDIPPSDDNSTGPWVCDQPGKPAVLADYPHIGNISVWALKPWSPHTWLFKDTLTCTEGRDVGQIYATVYWGGTYTYDSTPTTFPYQIQ
jgi:hypothetical protein